jgi:glutamyl-tRNA(Gln) amidotransferase subunit D
MSSSKSKAEHGDRVRVESGGKAHEGILMPGRDGSIVLKLDTGYNIGIDAKGATVEVVKKRTAPQGEPSDDGQRGDIAILGCGGTICSKVDYETGGVSPAISASELSRAFPKLGDTATIHARQLFQLLSEDMQQEHWKIAAESAAEEINSGAKGVVFMHGTDTMHYTSAAVCFALHDAGVPIVFVGSQRSSDRPSSDNEYNMMNAVLIAKSDIGNTGICMHANSSDTHSYFHHGARVRKMHSSRRDAFLSINSTPLAKADWKKGEITKLSECAARANNGKIKPEAHFSSNVGMLYTHPGLNAKAVEAFSDCDGLVLVGTGLGHVPMNVGNSKSANSIRKELEGLISSGIPVVMSTQTVFGRVNMDIYSTGRVLNEMGVIGNGADWTPETAFVKLCWVLGKEKKQDKVKELMMRNIAGELTERSGYTEKFCGF